MTDLKLSQIKKICEIMGLEPRDAMEAIECDDWLLLDDSEADDRCKEYILESLWAFNASFLSGETDLPEEIFTAIQNNGLCESNNDAILALIRQTCGVESFVESAISADGRGHFLSSYDGNEWEISGDLFLYRNN